MRLKAVIYVSESELEFSHSELADLAIVCAGNNKIMGVSGYLWYGQHIFLQYIEGDPTVIDALMITLENDPRHTIVSRVSTELKEAKFPNWSMNPLGLNKRLSMGPETLIHTQLLLLRAGRLGSVNVGHNVWHLVDLLAKHNNLVKSP